MSLKSKLMLRYRRELELHLNFSRNVIKTTLCVEELKTPLPRNLLNPCVTTSCDHLPNWVPFFGRQHSIICGLSFASILSNRGSIEQVLLGEPFHEYFKIRSTDNKYTLVTPIHTCTSEPPTQLSLCVNSERFII